MNYPVLSIYNIPRFWFGIPILFFTVFGFWLLFIALTYLIIRKTNKEKDA